MNKADLLILPSDKMYQYLKDNGLGFAVDALEEADRIVQNISEEDYRKLSKRKI